MFIRCNFAFIIPWLLGVFHSPLFANDNLGPLFDDDILKVVTKIFYDRRIPKDFDSYQNYLANRGSKKDSTYFYLKQSSFHLLAKTVGLAYTKLELDSCYEFKWYLGAGAEGVVSLARDSQGSQYVVKRIKKTSLTDLSEVSSSLQTLYKKWNNTLVDKKFYVNVVQLKHVDIENNAMIYPYSSGVPLSEILDSDNGLNQRQIERIIDFYGLEKEVGWDYYYLPLKGFWNSYEIKSDNILVLDFTYELLIFDAY